MDPITHGLAGYAIAKTGLTKDTGRWGVIAGVTAAFFPDVDSLVSPFLGTEFTIKHHRELTNSIFLVIPFALFLAWLFTKVSRKRRFRVFFVLSLVEITAHTFLDLVTSYGTMILSPFTRQRFALDWVFIVDFLLTGALFLGLIATVLWRKKDTIVARVTVCAAALYIVMCACNHSWALSLARTYAEEHEIVTQNIASLPQPLSPFHWGNYIVAEEEIYEGFVNLSGTQERTAGKDQNLVSRVWARYQPIDRLSYTSRARFDDSPWVKRALTLEGAKTFLWFARFPVARYEERSKGEHWVIFYDLRFGTIEGRRPFTYVVTFDPKGELVFEGFYRISSLID